MGVIIVVGVIIIITIIIIMMIIIIITLNLLVVQNLVSKLVSHTQVKSYLYSIFRGVLRTLSNF